MATLLMPFPNTEVLYSSDCSSNLSETAISWLSAITNTSKPTALILSRQKLPTFSRNESQINSISKGAYILYEPESKAELVLIATGSEVKLAMEVAEELKGKKNIRVVSMPCLKFDERQMNTRLY